MFDGTTYMKSNATDKPNLSNVEDMSYIFQETKEFNGDIGDWNN